MFLIVERYCNCYYYINLAASHEAVSDLTLRRSHPLGAYSIRPTINSLTLTPT